MRRQNIKNESDLLRAIHDLVPGEAFEELRTKSLTQQMVNNVLGGVVDRSVFTPFIAAALKVSPLWLGWGIATRRGDIHLFGTNLDDDATPGGRRVVVVKS